MTKKSILVTGGAGFIGANFLHYLINLYRDLKIINLDMLTYAADLSNIYDISENQYSFIEGDIRDADLLKNIFSKYQISGVIHFAAESHVDNSIKGPEEFITTNVNGTFHLLQACYKSWMDGPHKVKDGCEKFRFHHISTDEVYGSLGPEGKFTETTPYAPNSPYSASKAGADFLVRSYFHTFGLNVTTTNCSNNYGPFQHSEKLIPVIIKKALMEKPIPIYGDGKNVRDWLFVKDHCEAIERVFLHGRAGQTYNVGGDEEKTNIALCRTICEILDERKPRSNGRSYSELISFVKDRPGHDKRYAIDNSKIKEELGWAPKHSFNEGIRVTIDWYLEKFQ